MLAAHLRMLGPDHPDTHETTPWIGYLTQYADLRGTADTPTDSAEILAQFLRTLGMPHVPEAKQERLAVYRTLLAERRVLVVLDDAADEEQVSDLVPAEPGCAVLVRARRRLPGTDSYHVTLSPLDRKDAAELFVRVVSRAGIDLDDDPGSVDCVVALCGGLPLALRIAGALHVTEYPALVAWLAERLEGQGTPALEYDRLSITATIDRGFNRLTPIAGKLFLGLGLLALTEYEHWTAAALLGIADVDAATALSQLAANFMVEPVGEQAQ